MQSLASYEGSPDPETEQEHKTEDVGPASSTIEINIVKYHQQCLLLRSCGALLRFPPRPLATALAYIHKYYEADVGGEEVPHMDSCVSFSLT